MRLLILTIFIASGIGLLASCSNSNYQDLAPAPIIDTTQQVTYSQVASIMSQSCLGCHSATAAAQAGGGNVYETYEQVSGSASAIRNRINRSSGDQLLMPRGGPKLPASTIATIEAWITKGTPR